MLRIKYFPMSADTQELVRTFEQLPEAQRNEVAEFARFLLAQNQLAQNQLPGNQGAAPRREATQRWLAGARGMARPGVTTEQVMKLTRGEP